MTTNRASRARALLLTDASAQSSTVTLPDLLTVDEAAAYLHLSPRQVRQYTAEGLIGRVRLSPRKVAYTRADLAEFVDNARVRGIA